MLLAKHQTLCGFFQVFPNSAFLSQGTCSPPGWVHESVPSPSSPLVCDLTFHDFINSFVILGTESALPPPIWSLSDVVVWDLCLGRETQKGQLRFSTLSRAIAYPPAEVDLQKPG